jgi:predicted ester cyclase
MKKILSIAGIALFGFITSCQDSGGLSAKAKKNLEANHGIIKAFDTKDFSKLEDYMAEDFVDHAGETGPIKGLANARAEFEKMVAHMEPGKTEIILELANDDYVMSWLRFTGTLKEDMMGKKAGERYDMEAIELSKYKDGKAIEHWTFIQPAEMMKMMPSAPVMSMGESENKPMQ